MPDLKKQVLTELLVIQAQEGDPGAFTDLFTLWNSDLLRLATSRLGNREVAQDVTHERWINVAARIHTVRDPACFPKWLFQILFRRCADHQLKSCRQRTVQPTAVDSSTLDAIPAPDMRDDPATTRLRPGCRRQLQVCLHPPGSCCNCNTGRRLASPASRRFSGCHRAPVKSRLFHLREQLRTIIQTIEP